MGTPAVARLVVVSAAAVGVLAVAVHLGHGSRVREEGPAPVAVPVLSSGRSVPQLQTADAQRTLEQGLVDRSAASGAPLAGSGIPVVDESRPHTHVVDPATGGLVSVAGARGVVADVSDLGPVHLDPAPAGASLSAPTDTDTLLDRAGTVQAALAAGDQPISTGATAPIGTPDIDTLAAHVAPSCSGTGTDGKRVQVLYVHEATKASRFSSVLPILRDGVADVDDVFAVSSEQTGGGRRVRWVHDADCFPVISDVTVPAGALGPDFWGTVDALDKLGYHDPDRKYLMFADANQLCGIGTVYSDESTSLSNYNNGSAASYARVDANCWSTGESVAAHELTHTLGGVQGGAPHATTNGHCFDESDLMCYADGSGIPMQTVCPAAQEQLLDCNHDDYFSTNPVANSYLATHWNTAKSSFLDVVPALAGGPGVTVSSSATTAQSGDGVTFTAHADRSVGWRWGTSSSVCTLTPADGTATLTCPATGAGPVTVTATGTDATGATGSGSAVVTIKRSAAPTVQVTAPGSATVGTTFAVAATPGGKAPFGYRWSGASGCDYADPTAAATTVTCPGDTEAQILPVTVTVSQADGQSAARTTYVALAAVGSPAPTRDATGWSTPRVGRGTLAATLHDTTTASGVGGVPVTLQVRWLGSSSFVDVALLTTGPTGGVTGPTSTSRAGVYRFVYAGDQVRVAATSSGATVKVATRAAVARPRHKLLRVTLRTTTGSVVRGAPLMLQRRVAGRPRWLEVRSVRTDGAGRATVRVRPRRLTYYRWVFRGEPALLPTTSARVAVRR
jgi:hypothetical protein